MFSSVFGPSPRIELILPCSAASFSSVRFSTPISSKIRRAVLAPSPGTRVTSTRVAGNFAFSLSADGMLPVSIRVSIF